MTEITEAQHQHLTKLGNKCKIVMDTTAGCGSRSQCYIDDAFGEFNKALSDYGMKTVPVPKAYNDGTRGISSGITAYARNINNH